MSDARYLPASQTCARELPVGRLSIRTSDDRELGTLLGFVIDPNRRHISGLVMEVAGAGGSQQVESPLVPMRFDEEAQALCLVDHEPPLMHAFDVGSICPIAEEDLWIPLVHSAA